MRKFQPETKESLTERLAKAGWAAPRKSIRALPKKDLKVDFDLENLAIGPGLAGPQSLMGAQTLENGLTFLGCCAGGDWEQPVFFIVYFDGKRLRAYVPEKGNPWHRKEKRALTEDDDQAFGKRRFDANRIKEDILRHFAPSEYYKALLVDPGYVESSFLANMMVIHDTGFPSPAALAQAFLEDCVECPDWRGEEHIVCEHCGRKEREADKHLDDIFMDRLFHENLDGATNEIERFEDRGWTFCFSIRFGAIVEVSNVAHLLEQYRSSRIFSPHDIYTYTNLLEENS